MSNFSGFPVAYAQFFRDLAANNNREWFQAHKQDYIDLVQKPALNFIVTMGERLQTIFPGVEYDTRTNGAGSMMRIYRDTRFSKDKTPYKTNLGIVIGEGGGKKTERPGFYFHLDADGAWIHAGLHIFPKHFMEPFRAAVADDEQGAALQAALTTVSERYSTGGEQYKRVPRGHNADHPRADLLRYKGLHARSAQISVETAGSPQFTDICFEHCQNMAPLYQWLVNVYPQA